MENKEATEQNEFENDLQYFLVYLEESYHYWVLYNRVFDYFEHPNKLLGSYEFFVKNTTECCRKMVYITLTNLCVKDEKAKHLWRFFENTNINSKYIFGLKNKNSSIKFVHDIQNKITQYAPIIEKIKNVRNTTIAHFDKLSFNYETGTAYLLRNKVEVEEITELIVIIFQSLYNLHNYYCSICKKDSLVQFRDPLKKKLVFSQDFDWLIYKLQQKCEPIPNSLHETIKKLI